MTIKPFKHQTQSLAHSTTTPIVFDVSDPGCVSADTEFLTPTGWKRIDEYVEGDQVAQFYPEEREIEFVLPLAYVKKPCGEMIHIAPARGMSQRLSPEHRVLYYRPDGTHGVCSAIEYMTELYQRGANHLKRKFCTSFSVRGTAGIPMSDTDIRLMVAVIADGHFQSRTNHCAIRLKKARKIERLQRLLAEAELTYKQRQCGGAPDFTVFTFYAPRREKVFDATWWTATQRQLEIIASELPHWDSSISKRPSGGVRFSSFIEESAEFAQYAFSAAGHAASLNCTFRDRADKVMAEYVVHARQGGPFVGCGRKSSVYVAPNPEGFKYCFEVSTSFLLLRHNGYIFATGNTGKTYVRILSYIARHTRRKGNKAMLVLAPKSLLRNTWEDDIRKFAPHLRVSVADADNREEAFDVDADVYVTNIDAVVWLAKKPKAFFSNMDELVIDESSAYKHHTSKRSRAAAKIAVYFTYRTCMTGTPNGRSITDVWHQVYLLDQGKRLGGSFYAFRNSVCAPTQVGRNVSAIRWEDKDGAEEAVFGLLTDIVVRHKFEECVDIPANTVFTLNYELPKKQLKAYQELEKTQMLLMKAKTAENAKRTLLGEEPVDFHVVAAINAAAVAGKLLQVASGAVYESPGKYHVVDDGRYRMVIDLVEQRKHSLVFFLWKHQRDLMIAEAEKRGITFCTLDGETSAADRDSMVKAYQAGMFQVMFAHPKSAAHGLTLTRGTSTIWASPTYDLEWFKQGGKRQHRIGQTEKTETIVILAPGTIEEKVYTILTEKDRRMNNLLNLFGMAEEV